MRHFVVDIEQNDTKTLARQIYSDRDKQKERDYDASGKRHDKNARASHGFYEYNAGKKKLGLLGQRLSRQAATDELLNDALDLMDAQEEAIHDSKCQF